MATQSGYFVALLRGINVGGKNLLPMKGLALLFANAGCADVATYIQSGNVVFRADAALADQISKRLEAAIFKKFKIEVPVIVRNASQIRKAARSHPHFEAGQDTRALHVGFFATQPAKSAIALLDPARSPGDSFHIQGKEIYFHLPNGAGRSKLTSQYFDSRLGTSVTVRNWNTLLKLVEMTGGAPETNRADS